MAAEANRTRARCRRGFSLVEVLIALGLSVIILSAILTTFLVVTKGGIRLMAFHDMESHSSLAVQRFASDARQASSATWVSASELALEVPDTGTVRYIYSSANGTFSRTTSSGTRILATDIRSFRFVAYDRDGDAVDLGAANVDARTKMVQLEIRCQKGGAIVPAAKTDLISARYVLRNKLSS